MVAGRICHQFFFSPRKHSLHKAKKYLKPIKIFPLLMYIPCTSALLFLCVRQMPRKHLSNCSIFTIDHIVIFCPFFLVYISRRSLAINHIYLTPFVARAVVKKFQQLYLDLSMHLNLIVLIKILFSCPLKVDNIKSHFLFCSSLVSFLCQLLISDFRQEKG